MKDEADTGPAWTFEAKLAALQFEWHMLRREHVQAVARTKLLIEAGDIAALLEHYDVVEEHQHRLRLFATALRGFIGQYGAKHAGLPVLT